LVYHSIVPASGVYRGVSGLANFHMKWKKTAQLDEDVKSRVLFADEARGIAGVECTYKGTFIHSGKNFELKSIAYIKFKLGKVRLMAILDGDYSKTIDLYERDTDKKFCQLLEGLYLCGGDCDEVSSQLSEDVTVKLQMYPLHLVQRYLGSSVSGAKASERGHAIKGMSPRGRNQEQTSGELVLRGNKAASLLLKLGGDLIVNRTLDVVVLNRGENSITAAFVLTPRQHMIYNDFKSKLNLIKTVTVMTCYVTFNDQGLIKSLEISFNRPFMPWELAQLRFDQNVGNLIERVLSSPTSTTVARDITTEHEPIVRRSRSSPLQSQADED